MPFEYVGVDEAIRRPGLRMVVVGGIPSPWGEAAKGIFHVKRLEWAAVRLDYESEPLRDWAGQRSGPVAVYEKERPRSGWAEILLLAERLAPAPALIPPAPFDRALMFGLSHELVGEGGLAWSRRLQLIHGGLNGGPGFPPPVAKYLAKKYGYTAEAGAAAAARVAQLLEMLAARLKKEATGYYVAGTLTAADVYSATCMAMFRPLAQAQCRMDPATRGIFETPQDIDPALLEHRDRIYDRHLELPLKL
jgi:glutathione S-transferase